MLHDKDTILVLRYLVTHQYGYLRDLNKLKKPAVISELMGIGLLTTGCAPDGPTFALTPLGIKYCNVINIGNRPFIRRLFNKMRCK